MLGHRLARCAATIALAAGSIVLGGAGGASAAISSGPSSGRVYVLHGISGLKLQFFIDNRSIGGAMATKSIIGPISLPAGTHSLSMRQGTKVVSQETFTVAAGTTTDLVAHRFADASRAPTLTTFPLDLSAVAPGKARLLIAHTAAVQPADVLVDGTVLIRNVANGESSTSVVPGGAYKVAIVPTATTGPAVLGPTTLPVRAGTLTAVFAIGDPVAGTMDAVVQYLGVPVVGASMPAKVNTGDGGQAAGLFAEQGSAPGLAPNPGLSVLLAVVGAATLTVLRRRRRTGAPGTRLVEQSRR